MNAAFFDLDGTLADTRADLTNAVNDTRLDLGLSTLPQDDVLVHVGRGARNLLLGTIPDFPEEKTLPLFKQHYADRATDRIQLYPGVTDTLHELNRRGWRLGVNTNKPRFATLKILRHFHLDELFGDAVIAGGDLPNLKPDPGTLVECARRMDHTLSPDDWMIGDNWTDLDVARNAGIKSAFVTFGFGRLNDSSYTAKIDHFADLLDLLG